MFVISFDYETSPENFWLTFQEKFPELWDQLDRHGSAAVDQGQLKQIQEIEGFETGMQHAPHPIIIVSTDDILDVALDHIETIIKEDCLKGANDYAYVRLWRDGEVTSGREPSKCVPISEYYKQDGHPITIWETSGIRDSHLGMDGGFVWEIVDGDFDLSDSENFWEIDGIVYTNGTELTEDIRDIYRDSVLEKILNYFE